MFRGPLVTDQGDSRPDSTRQQILRAASHQFAHSSYSLVSLDDILAEAEVTKGAMYFHFRSKRALAIAIIEQQTRMARDVVNELLARRLSGLETLVDIFYAIAAQETGDEVARAGIHLLESIGRTEGLQVNLFREWIRALAVIIERASTEGDVIEGRDPEDVSRLVVSLYVGIRQTSDLDEPEQFLANLEKGWVLALPGFVNPDRIEYLTQFIKRRTTLAIKNVARRDDSA